MTTKADIYRSALNQATQALKAIQNVSGDFLIKYERETISDIAADALALIDRKLNDGAQTTSDLMPEALDSANNESPYLPLTKNFDEQAIKARVESIGDGWKLFALANYAHTINGVYLEFVVNAHADLRAVLRELSAQRFYTREYAETLDMVEAKMKSVFPNTDLPFMTHVENQQKALQAVVKVWQQFKQSGYDNFGTFLDFRINPDLFEKAEEVLEFSAQLPVLSVNAPVMQVIEAIKSDNTDGENDD